MQKNVWYKNGSFILLLQAKMSEQQQQQQAAAAAAAGGNPAANAGLQKGNRLYCSYTRVMLHGNPVIMNPDKPNSRLYGYKGH